MKRLRRCVIGVLTLPLLCLSSVSGALAGETGPGSQKESGAWAQTAGAYVPGQLIVRFKDGKRSFSATTFSRKAKVLERAGEAALLEVPKEAAADVAAELARDPNVAYVEPNYVYKTAEVPEESGANDPLYPEQWGLPAVGAPAAWDMLSAWTGPKAGEVVVAVADTGVDDAHPDLAGRVLKGYNAIDENGDTSDWFGHGTHVAGIIAAQTDNEEGVAGVAGTENVKILPIKVLDDDGYGTSLSVAWGIDKAVELGADVINLSLGGQGHSKLVEEAIRNATAKGVLVIAAAGNSADNAEGYFPARLQETVAVAAVDESLAPTWFSNYGSSVDIAAPGEGVLSTVPDGEYDAWDGTSMATPFVSGAAALVKLAHPDWGAQEIRAALEKSARDIDRPGFDAGTGHGLLQVADALSFNEQDDPVRIVSPQQGSYVWGSVDVRVRVTAASAAQVSYSLEQGEPLGTAFVTGGEATFRWDTWTVADGDHTVAVQALDAAGRPIGKTARVLVKIRNDAKGGARLHVLDPEGRPAYGAFVDVLRVEGDENGEYLETVMSGYVNDQGFAYVPREVFLPGERYVAAVGYLDADQEEYYTLFEDLYAGKDDVTLHVGETATVEAQVVSGSAAYPVADGHYLFVPVLQGVEEEGLAVYEEADETGKALLHLSPGRYVGYAVGVGENGRSYWLRQTFTVGTDTATVSFDLAKARNITFRLPDWADSGFWYPDGGHLFLPGVPVERGKGVYVTPEEKVGYWLDLYLTDEDGYMTLFQEKPLDLSRTKTVTVPDAAKPRSIRNKGDGEQESYRPGDRVSLPYQVTFGKDLVLDDLSLDEEWDWDDGLGDEWGRTRWIKNRLTKKPVALFERQGLLTPAADEEDDPQEDDPFAGEAGPHIVLANQDGEEVWRGPGLYDFEVPDLYNLESGTYEVTVDFRNAPFPAKPEEWKVRTIEINAEERQTEVELAVTAPDRSGFEAAEVAVLEPDTGEYVDGDYSLWGDEDEPLTFWFPELALNHEYLFRVSGILTDGTPIFVERLVKVPSPRFSIDLSQKSTRPQRVKVSLAEGTYAGLVKDGQVVPSFHLYDQTETAWLDRGAHEFLVIAEEENGRYLSREEVEIHKGTKTLTFAPDRKKFSRVTVDGGEMDEAEWLLGVKPAADAEEDPVSPLYLYELLPLEEERPLYLSEDEYDFVLMKSEREGDVETVSTMLANPDEDGDELVFSADGNWRVRLKPEQSAYRPGEEVKVDVRVTDGHGNRLTGVLQTVANPMDDLSVPLRLALDKAGKPQILALDAGEGRYEPIAVQEVKPTVAWKLDGETVSKSKDAWYWTRYERTLPDDWKAGEYDLNWSSGLPQLSARTKIEIK